MEGEEGDLYDLLVKQVLLANPMLALNQELGLAEYYIRSAIAYIFSYIAFVAWTIDLCR